MSSSKVHTWNSSSQFSTPTVCNFGNLNGKKVEDLEGYLRQIEKTEAYKLYEDHCLYGGVVDFKQIFTCRNRALGLIASALFVSVICTQILLFSGHLTTLPQDFMHFIHNVNLTHLAIGGVVTVILVGGAAIVIHRACTGGEKLTNTISIESKGAFRNMDKHLKPVGIKWINTKGESYSAPVYIDTSTLTKEGKGVAYIYAKKGCADHYSVSTALSLATPLYLVGTVVYNLLRAVIIPFYILGCWVSERFMDKGIFERKDSSERKFKLLDIPIEIGTSIYRAIVAPFYALAFFFAAVLSIIDPGWRKLASFIERDWNHGVTRSEGFWLTMGAQKLWHFEGGGGPKKLGSNGLYVGGCLQPMGVSIDGKTISLSEAVKEGKGYTYTVITQEELKKREEEFRNNATNVDPAMQEYERIAARVKELKHLKC